MTTYKKTETTKMPYTKVEIPNCQDHYYVVTMLQKEPSCQQCIVSGNTDTTTSFSTSNQEIFDEDSVDISGVASKINQEYGNNITEESWLEFYQATGSYRELNWQVPWHHQYKLILILRIMMLLDVSCFFTRILH